MRLLPLLLLGPALLLASCGGGGGGGGGNNVPTQQVVVIHPVDWGAGIGGAFFDGAVPEVGDNFNNAGLQGLFRFPLAVIPAGAQIVSVQFETPESALGNPFTVFAGFRTEVIDAGGNLEFNDLVAAPVAGSFAVDFSTPVPGGANRILDVTDMLQKAIAAGLTNFDLRTTTIGVPTNNDNASDLLTWAVDPATFPTVTVTFVP